MPGFPPTLMPFASDEAGNYTCLDVKSGALVDWDHETRKKRKLPGSLSKIFTEVIAALKQEARAGAAVTPDVPASAGALPTAIRPLKSPVLRKLSAYHRLHGFDGAALSSDGKLVAAMVSGTHDACFGDLASNGEHLPREPGFAEQKRARGSVQMRTNGFVFDEERLAWRLGDQLSCWSWREGVLGLETGGRWTKTKPDFLDKVPLRLRGGRLAAAAIVKERVVIALWEVDAFPKVKALTGATTELAPKTVLPVGPWEGRELLFDLDETGVVTTLESPKYLTISLTRWDAKSGKRLAQKRVNDVDAVDLAVSRDGTRILVLSRGGELLVFDPKLTPGARLKTFSGKKRSSGVRFAPSGAFFVTSAQEFDNGAGELVTWDSLTLEPLARLPVKEAAQGFQLRAVARTAAVTTSPLAAFELREG